MKGRKKNGELKKGYKLTKSGVRKVSPKKSKKRKSGKKSGGIL